MDKKEPKTCVEKKNKGIFDWLCVSSPVEGGKMGGQKPECMYGGRKKVQKRDNQNQR